MSDPAGPFLSFISLLRCCVPGVAVRWTHGLVVPVIPVNFESRPKCGQSSAVAEKSSLCSLVRCMHVWMTVDSSYNSWSSSTWRTWKRCLLQGGVSIPTCCTYCSRTFLIHLVCYYSWLILFLLFPRCMHCHGLDARLADVLRRRRRIPQIMLFLLYN